MGVADAAGEVAVAGDHAQARDVDVSGFGIAAVLGDDVLDDLFGVGMMDEARLERRADLDVFFDRHVVLRELRVDRAEGFLDHAARVVDELEHRGLGRVNVELPVVETSAADVVGGFGIEIDGIHDGTSPFGVRE